MEEDKKINDMKEKEENLRIYNILGVTPKDARKTIQAGRLKGFTDINPMYRIKALTNLFGACGTGWKYEILKTFSEKCEQNGEVAVFVEIALYYRETPACEWSSPVVGLGGSKFIVQESKGVYVDDDAYKKALTDAISNATKNLGMCADIYYANDLSFGSKYANDNTDFITLEQYKKIKELNIDENKLCAYYGVDSIEKLAYSQAHDAINKKENKK